MIKNLIFVKIEFTYYFCASPKQTEYMKRKNTYIMKDNLKLKNIYLSFLVFCTIIIINCTFQKEEVNKTNQHYKNAKILYHQISNSNSILTYKHPKFNIVVEELKLVPEDSPDYKDSQILLSQLLKLKNKNRSQKQQNSTKKKDAKVSGKNKSFKDYKNKFGKNFTSIKSENEVKIYQGPISKSNPKIIYIDSKSDKEVIIYGTTWCGACMKAKKYFDKKEISFSFKNVDKDEKAKLELLKIRFRNNINNNGIPVITIDNHTIIGFSKIAVERALKL